MSAGSDDSSARPARAHLRAPIDVFVRIAGADREYAFRTRDLSEGGLFLYTRVGHLYPFALGSAVAIEVQDGNTVIALVGEVVRIVQPGTAESEEYPLGFGLRLQQLDGKARAALQSLIARHTQK